MTTQSLPVGLSQPPKLTAYLLALALGLAAALVRAALATVVPGASYFAVLFPAVVIAGVFCGTWPGVLTACVAGLVSAALLSFPSLFAGPLLQPGHVMGLIYVPVCAAILWATDALRRAASVSANAEARLAEVFRQVPAAAALLEAPTGRLLLHSAKSVDVLGHPSRVKGSAEDLASYGGIDSAGRPYRPDEYPIVRALKHGEIVTAEKLRYRQPSGNIVDLEVYAGPVHDAEGKVVASVGMAFDVTERAAAEQRLRESEANFRAAAERLRAALEAGAFGLWELDLVTRQMRIDAAMAAMLGREPVAQEMPQAEMRSLMHPDDAPEGIARLAAAIEAGGTYADERRVMAADGSVRWFVSRGTVLKDAGKVIGVVSDVTERRERENALRAALQARDVLMYEADHRIKNSLQLVVSLLRIQLKKSSDLAIRNALGEAIARVDAIANAHLALQESPDLRSIRVGAMLAHLCDRIAMLNPSVEVLCQADCDISLDAEQAIPLGLIASELLTNSLRHAFPAGATGAVVLRLGLRAGRLEMVIEDGGTGFPAGTHPVGLGSTLIGTLARQIGAEIVTCSTPGKGVVASVFLALSRDADRLPVAEAAEAFQ